MITALVTGANGSIGLGICEQLLSKYSISNNEIKLLLLCRSEQRGLKAREHLLNKCELSEKDRAIAGNMLHVIPCDLSIVENGKRDTMKMKD